MAFFLALKGLLATETCWLPFMFISVISLSILSVRDMSGTHFFSISVAFDFFKVSPLPLGAGGWAGALQ